jgi:hypothetical protein
MQKHLIILCLVFCMTIVIQADQSGGQPAFAEYFALNSLTGRLLINQTPTAPTIAVIELKGQGVMQTEAATITDRLRNELAESGEFKIYNREMMLDILTKSGFPVVGCVDQGCLVKAGKLLNVKQIIGGIISQDSNGFAASAIVVDVNSGAVMKTSTFETGGDINIIITEGMTFIGKELGEALGSTATAEPVSPGGEPSTTVAGASPVVEEPSPPKQTVETQPKFPVKKDTVEQAFFKEDLFESALTGDIYEFEAKSTKRAFFYSLLLPGAGEYYAGSRIKPVVFLGLEALLWTGYFVYDNKGDNKKDEYIAYADAHYEWWNFMIWWNSLSDTVQDKYSHELPWDEEQNTPIRSHEYYENIGKYDQFQLGWDDIDDDPRLISVISDHRDAYLNLRKDSNDLYSIARTMVMLSLGNHIISAFDAALTAKSYNKGQKRYSFKLNAKDFGGEKVTMLTCSYRF